jgi:hypothetical protein
MQVKPLKSKLLTWPQQYQAQLLADATCTRSVGQSRSQAENEAEVQQAAGLGTVRNCLPNNTRRHRHQMRTPH